MARFIDTSGQFDIQIGLPFDPSSTNEIGYIIAQVLDKNIQIALRKDTVINDYCVMVYNQDVDYKDRVIYVYHSDDIVHALIGMLCYILAEKSEGIIWSTR